MLSWCLHKFCICIPLNIGAFILGYILLVLKSVMIFIFTLGIQAIETTRKHFWEEEISIPELDLLVYFLYAFAIVHVMQLLTSIYLVLCLHLGTLVQIQRFYKVYPIQFMLYIIGYVVLEVTNPEHTPWYTHLTYSGNCIIDLYTIYIVYRLAIERKSQSAENEGVAYAAAPV